MSIHPSLSSAIKGKQQRSVLKRSERIRQHMKKGEWTETSKVYGLPKIKMTRLKVKKEKAAEKPEAEAAEATGAQAVPAPAPAAAEQTKSKAKP